MRSGPPKRVGVDLGGEVKRCTKQRKRWNEVSKECLAKWQKGIIKYCDRPLVSSDQPGTMSQPF